MSRLSMNLEKFKKRVVKEPKGPLKYPYLIPAGPYRELWDWDSFFTGVALVYDGKAEVLKFSVMNMLNLIKEDGRTPWLVDPESPREILRKGKPFLAQGAFVASYFLEDYSWVSKLYDNLRKSVDYWDKRKKSNGLFVWKDGRESGSDNNPAVMRYPEYTVAGVDINCFLYREYLAIALIARELGKKDDYYFYSSKARELRFAINKRMWSSEHSFYFNIDSRNGRKIKIKSWVGFLPLWVKIASRKQAKLMVENYLLNPEEFLSPFGFRSLSLQSPDYNQKNMIKPCSNWQGPIWVVANYLLCHGLNNYGYKKEALEIADKIEKMLLRDIETTGVMHECYNAETGEGLAAPGFVSWNLLAEHLRSEIKKDFDPTLPEV